MATDSNRFPLQSAIKKILDDPNSRPELPGLDEGSIVGDGNFGKGDFYETGKWSDIAVNNGNVVVEVHNTTDSKSLYYRVGKINGGKIDWDESHYYDKGVRPSVAINNNGLVVEVHKSQGLRNTFWHRLGQVEGGTIKWRNNDTSTEYGAGLEPSVAITDDELVVEVHQSITHDEESGQLYYQVGRVKGDTIDWGESHYYDNGVQPSVAITNDGLAIEVHTSQNFNTLYYHVGRVKDDKTIDWGKSHFYDNGVYPSVAITNDGLVVEVHQSQSHNTVWYSGPGKVNNNTINWDNEKSQNYSDGTTPKVACNGQLAVETHSGADNQLLYSVLTLPAFRSNWIELHGDNSYCYCACNRAADNKLRHASDKTMNVKEGAPYLYAVLTKDDDSIDFPTGAVMTIEGPDGTKYDRDIEEENQLVIMSGSSVRCLIVKDPKPGDWKMTMTVPEGVGFHCECNTVPSKDVYDTITETLDNSLQKRGLGTGWTALGWFGLTALGAILFPEVEVAVIAVRALWMAASVDLVSHVVPGKSGDRQTVELSTDEQIQAGNEVIKSINKKYKKGGIRKAADLTINMSYTKTKNKKKKEKPNILVNWNCQGANWNTIASSPWIKLQEWFIRGNSDEDDSFPYKIHVACLQECGSPPPSISSFPNTLPPYESRIIGNGVTLEKYFWNVSTDRNPLFLYILFYKWDVNGNRVNLAVVSPAGASNEQYLPGHYRPLIGIEQGRTYFYTIHASSGGGRDAWALLRDIAQRHNDPNTSWWVAGDYNLEPTNLKQKLTQNGINVKVCPPDKETWKTENPTRKLDYATRNESAIEIIGIVSNVGFGFSDHFPVFYLLG